MGYEIVLVSDMLVEGWYFFVVLIFDVIVVCVLYSNLLDLVVMGVFFLVFFSSVVLFVIWIVCDCEVLVVVFVW